VRGRQASSAVDAFLMRACDPDQQEH